jgi:type IV fimbrial biogenesis protein FimT
MVTALNVGRSEATRRGVTIEVCSSNDAATCSGNNDWSNGWIVRTLPGQVIRSWPALSGGPGILTGNVNRLQFRARGMLAPGPAPQLAMALPHSTGNQCRNIAVNVAGRIAVNRVACP